MIHIKKSRSNEENAALGTLDVDHGLHQFGCSARFLPLNGASRLIVNHVKRSLNIRRITMRPTDVGVLESFTNQLFHLVDSLTAIRIDVDSAPVHPGRYLSFRKFFSVVSLNTLASGHGVAHQAHAMTGRLVKLLELDEISE